MLDKLISQAETEIEAIYLQRVKSIRQEIQAMYDKYAVKGVLTLADMTKFNRLANSLKAINREISQAQKEAYRVAQTTMEQQYLQNYFRSAYLFEFEAQQDMGFGVITRATLEAAIANPVDKLRLPALLQRNRAIVIARIKAEIQQGLLAGASYFEMADRIKQVVAIDMRKAKATARTEAHRVQVEARRQAAEQASEHVTLDKVWDATLDLRTRPAHRLLDGISKPMGGLFSSITGAIGPQPGMMANPADDINCRCSLIYRINGRNPEIRRERLDNGKTNVIPYLTYEAWYKNRIKK